MSSRVIKKLGLATNDIPKLDQDSEYNSAKDDSQKLRRRNNIFDLLCDGTQSESDEGHNAENVSEFQNLDRDIDVIKTQSRKKRDKKKNKNKNKSNKISACSISNNDGSEDEIDRSVKEINQMLGVPKATFKKTYDAASEAKRQAKVENMKLLYVHNRYLNSSKELQRRFGAKVVQEVEGQSSGIIGKRGYRNRYNVKLVTAKNSWPPFSHDKGLKMLLVSSNSEISFFKFDHDREYRKTQIQFLNAHRGYSLQSMIDVLNQNPYHLDALIQTVALCMIGEDYTMTTQLLERALFHLETSFHPAFDFYHANARLKYTYRENRAFFIIFFMYTLMMGVKSCYRTALEFCKILFSVSPEEDPVAVVLCIDYFALQAREYQWLDDFINAWAPRRNLLQLPNFLFSHAVNNFYLNHTEKADEVLQEALLLFPSVVFMLADRGSLQINRDLISHPYFNPASTVKIPQSCAVLIRLYVERYYPIWKDCKLIRWLENNIRQVIQLLDSDNPLPKKYKRLRERRFKSVVPINIKRHIILSGLNIVCDVYADVSPSEQNYYDPVPPEQNYFDPVSSDQNGVQVLELEQGPNILSELLHSLLPYASNRTMRVRNVVREEDYYGNNAVQELPANVAATNRDADDDTDDEDLIVELVSAQQPEGMNGESLRSAMGSLVTAIRNLVENLEMEDDEYYDMIHEGMNDP